VIQRNDCADFDDKEVESISYDDDDVADLMEEPVAISQVRAFALARRSTGQEYKMTLESARVKLDRVKVTREKHLKKRKLENFLSGKVQGGVNLLLASEFQGQPKVVKSKGFSVEKACAKLEAVKIKKDLDKTNVDKHMNMYITSSPGKVRASVVVLYCKPKSGKKWKDKNCGSGQHGRSKGLSICVSVQHVVAARGREPEGCKNALCTHADA
jgi:hypothetical protein